MLAEIKAAVRHIEEHLCSGAPPAAAERLAKSLSTTLPERCSASWDTDQPEKGSASRALHWQRHPGGEGLDSILIDACLDAGAIDDVEAMRWLPAPFTLWIDPGCVAVRLGPGPGASKPGFIFADGTSASTSTFRHGRINVIFGQLPIESPSLGNSNLPTVALLPSTPNLNEIKASMAQRQATSPFLRAGVAIPFIPRAPSGLAIGAVYHHQRTASDASNSSMCSSTFSTVTRGGSEVSRCTSMSSSSSSSSSVIGDGLSIRRGSECCDAEEQRSSMMMMDDLAEETVQISLDDARLAGFFGTFDLVDEEEREEGDATIRAIDIGKQPINCSTPARNACSTRPEIDNDATSCSTTPIARPCFVPSHKKQSASGSDLNFTVHDRGNVGVLGGGVKLGGSSPAKKDRAQLRPISPSTSTPSSGSISTSPVRITRAQAQAPVWVPSGGGNDMGNKGVYPSLPPPESFHHRAVEQAWIDANVNAPQQQQHRRQFSHPQHFVGGGAFARAPPALAPGFDGAYTFPAPSSKTNINVNGLFSTNDVFNNNGLAFEQGYGLCYGAGPVVAPAASHSFLNIDPAAGYVYGGGAPGLRLGMTVPVPFPGQGKRVRSRGRRSRGRGAGRAARRHAAALRALAEKQGKTLEEFLAGQEENDERLRNASSFSSSAKGVNARREEHDEEDDDEDEQASDDEERVGADSRRSSVLSTSSSSASSSSGDTNTPRSPPTPRDIASGGDKSSTVNVTVTATANATADPSGRTDDIMRLVRQRADEVARSLEKRRMADLELRRNQGMANQYGMAGVAWGHQHQQQQKRAWF